MKKRTGRHVEGKSVFLRNLTIGDANGSYHRWMNDPEVTRYLEARFYPRSMEDIKKYVEAMANNNDEVFMAICLKEGGRHIGNIKLGPINHAHKFAYIGLVIGEKDCWGKGYATEAISLIVDYAFEELGLHRVMAGCYSNNSGSVRAFEKAGFVREGLEKEKWLCDGKYVDGITLGFVNPGQKAGRNG